MKQVSNLLIAVMRTLFIFLLVISVVANAATKRDQAVDILKLQVLLDRQNFSPGEIDGRMGSNTRSALAAFQESHKLPPTGQPDPDTLKALEPQPTEPLTEYTITAHDVAGPFAQNIPKDYMEQAKLEALPYTSIMEELGEKVHCSPALLKKLNPNARFQEGETISVPNMVSEPNAETAAADNRHLRVVVTEKASTLQVFDAEGNTVFFAPVTAGSQMDPLPIGTWKVLGISKNPKFHYNPELFWDAKATDTKTTIPPGPNNPVGVVWIDLNAPHYGLHGTPEPSRIGYSESHGCVRLTNWDAMRLAGLVHSGTEVIFQNEGNTQSEPVQSTSIQ